MLSRAVHNMKIYSKLQMLHLRVYLEHEADFWILILGMAVTHGVGLVFIWALFSRVSDVAGWSLWEVAFLYALSIIPRGLVEILCNGQWDLRAFVNQGEFDQLLIRPISPALQVITLSVGIFGFGSVIICPLILMRAMHELGISWSVWQYLLLAATLSSSVVLISSINFASNCIAFWDPSAHGTFPFMVQNFLEFNKFPLGVYDKLVQILLTWVLPFAFVSYYPGILLLGRAEANPWLGYCSPLVGPIVAFITSFIWRRGLNRYEGTGH